MSHFDLLLAKKLSGGGGGDSPFKLLHKSAEYAVGDIVSSDDVNKLDRALNNKKIVLGFVIDSNGNKYNPCPISKYDDTTIYTRPAYILWGQAAGMTIAIQRTLVGSGVIKDMQISDISYMPIPTGVTLEKFYFETYEYNFN